MKIAVAWHYRRAGARLPPVFLVAVSLLLWGCVASCGGSDGGKSLPRWALWIYLDGAAVTLQGATRLKQHLPNTRITYIFGESTL